VPKVFDESRLVASVCRDNFTEFCKEFWSTFVVEKLHWNWHMTVLTETFQEVMERVFRGEPRSGDVVINISPGTSKSSILSVMSMPWVWTRMPSAKGIFGSHSYELALDLSLKSRDVVLSKKYKDCFPEVRLRSDQAAKGYFANTSGGYRFATATRGNVIGRHAHLIVVDDPLDPMEAYSEAKLEEANRWLQHTLPSRKVDKSVTPTFLVMQRLADGDPSDLFLQRPNVTHVCLPARLEDTVYPPDLAGRYSDDGLMDPVRLPEHVLIEAESDMGQFAFSSQFLQKVVPPEGGMFHVDQFQVHKHAPTMDRVARAWDKAGSEARKSNYTAGVLMGVDLTGKFWVLDVVRVRLDSGKREDLIRRTADQDATTYGMRKLKVVLEQEGGPIWDEELVQMTSGARKKLKNIKVGDRVINRHGKPTDVTAVHVQGMLDCVRIETESGRVVHGALSHPFLTPHGWVKAGKLKVGDVLGLRTAIKTEPNSSPSVEECRLAGYFVGDGCCTWTKDMSSCNAAITCRDFMPGLIPDPIVKIEPAGKMPCRCISVASGESFLVRDIVVHNSGGLESAQNTVRNLAGYRVVVNKVGRSYGDKVQRADPFSVQVNRGNVNAVEGAWNADYFNELKHFPQGRYDDMVDATSGAFQVLYRRKRHVGGIPGLAVTPQEVESRRRSGLFTFGR
jgi:hypothetical protein